MKYNGNIEKLQSSTYYSDIAFKATGNLVQDIVDSMPNPAHVKESGTGKYLMSNKSNLNIYGLENTDAIIGRTILELDNFMKPFWGKDFAEHIDNIDKDVVKNKQMQLVDTCTFLDKKGLIHIQHMTKHPVVGVFNKVMGILTLTFEHTQNIDLIELLNIYRTAYDNNKKGIKFFLKHLKLDRYFYQDLTYKETLCLLYMRKNQSYKSIAKSMNISLKTIETHLSHIMNKINNLTVSDILEFLRKDFISWHGY